MWSGGKGGGGWRHKNAPVLGIKVTTLKRKTTFVDPAELSTVLQTSETFSFFSPLFPPDMQKDSFHQFQGVCRIFFNS